MKRLIFYALLALLPGAAAHDTTNAGAVQVTWHTDTNEFLQAAGDTTLTLSLKVAGKPLNAAGCRCTLLLYRGAVSPRVKPTVLPWTAGPDGTVRARISVDTPGRYTVVLDGKPVRVNDFAAFRVTLPLDAVDDVFNAPRPTAAPPAGQP